MAKKFRTVAELERLLATEEKELMRLRKRRVTLETALGALASQIAELKGPAVPKAKRVAKRPRKKAKAVGATAKRHEGTLSDAIIAVLGKSGKAMRAGEIAELLPSVGHKSTSKNLRNLVSAQIGKIKALRRVGKGRYALKKR